MSIKKLYFKFTHSFENEGFIIAIKKLIKFIVFKLKKNKIDPIDMRRLILSNKIDQLFNSTVKYGQFQGLRLISKSWWGASDRASILFGLYEQEVLNSLKNIPSRYKYFIDLGAADGYYAIGVLISGLCKKSYCFEISEKGREIIKENAIINNVLDSIEIRGIAKQNFYESIPLNEIEESILFIDIEGGEFEILNKASFSVFKKSIIFIELHDWFYDDGDEKLKELKLSAGKTHAISEIIMKSRDLSIYEELKTYPDNDRWLICSEGRGQLMTWLRLDPIEV